ASFDSSSMLPNAAGQFEWVAETEDVREEPYQIVFVAREPTSRLSDLEAIRIKVNALTNAAEATTAPPTLKAYPNPSGGLVQIELPAPNARYQLLDAQGRTVRTGVLNGNPANLNISLLPDGWYVLSCWQNGQYLGQVRLLK
ncbi:MAG TPA: T9SS type A sorting domain-containing protein, partial [Phaeodactylibacter sp.]|nr:T9SS type A sorting domain-containing protein [Phaeodactylibacter sp.]